MPDQVTLPGESGELGRGEGDHEREGGGMSIIVRKPPKRNLYANLPRAPKPLPRKTRQARRKAEREARRSRVANGRKRRGK